MAPLDSHNVPAPWYLEALERLVLSPVIEWIEEAERKETARWRKIHGPDDAPGRPDWDVEWCDGCYDWRPPSNVAEHSCYRKPVWGTNEEEQAVNDRLYSIRTPNEVRRHIMWDLEEKDGHGEDD